MESEKELYWIAIKTDSADKVIFLDNSCVIYPVAATGRTL